MSRGIGHSKVAVLSIVTDIVHGARTVGRSNVLTVMAELNNCIYPMNGRIETLRRFLYMLLLT